MQGWERFLSDNPTGKESVCMPRRIFLPLLAAAMILTVAGSAFGVSPRPITVHVPVSVIQTALQRLLPLELTPIKQLSGRLWLKSVRHLKLGDNQASFLTTVYGKRIGLNMGSLIVDIGTVDLSFHSLVKLRYDKAAHVLYIKPHVTQKNVKAEKQEVGADLTQLLSIFNEVEYPVSLKSLRPLVADTSSGKILVHWNVTAIRTRNGMLTVELVPRFDKRAAKRKSSGKMSKTP